MAALLDWISLFITLPGNPVVGWLLVGIAAATAIALAIRTVGKREASHGIGYLITLVIALVLFTVFVLVEYIVMWTIPNFATAWSWVAAAFLVIVVILIIYKRHNRGNQGFRG